jgi:AcrR family transcriptional regulator
MFPSADPAPAPAVVAELPQLPGARAARDPARAIKRGPSRLPPEVVAATQRDRLFDGLVQTVAEKGYVNARVGDICLAAGVTRPAFYALFEGKEDAFIAAYRHGANALWALLQKAHRDTPGWTAAARVAMRTLLNTLAAVPSFATVALVEIDTAGPLAREERDRLLRKCHELFLKAPLPPGCEPSVAYEDLVTSVVGGIYATIRARVVAGDFAGLPALLPTLTYFTLVPFLGPKDAAAAAEQVDDEEIFPDCLPPQVAVAPAPPVARRAPAALFRSGS